MRVAKTALIQTPGSSSSPAGAAASRAPGHGRARPTIEHSTGPARVEIRMAGVHPPRAPVRLADHVVANTIAVGVAGEAGRDAEHPLPHVLAFVIPYEVSTGQGQDQ